MSKLQIIYLAGVGRSGTTVLDRILGTLDGVISFNEIYRIFAEGFEENNLCACGKHFEDCEFWQEVVGRVTNGPDDVARLASMHHAVDHSRHFLRIYTGLHGKQFRTQVEEFRNWLKELYLALADVSGKNIIVDSSKVPTHGLLLSGIKEFDVHVVHVVRDARAVVHAWQKQKFNPAAGRDLPTYSVSRSVLFWNTRNILTELLKRVTSYQRVRYEDFSRNPQSVLQHMVEQIPPVAEQRLPFLEDGSIELDALHTIGGNPDRFQRGATKIRMDSAWMEKLDPGLRKRVGMLASPLLYRYGYFAKQSQD